MLGVFPYADAKVANSQQTVGDAIEIQLTTEWLDDEETEEWEAKGPIEGLAAEFCSVRINVNDAVLANSGTLTKSNKEVRNK